MKAVTAVMLFGIGFALLRPSAALGASPWDGVQTGHIVKIDVADHNNYDFRVYLDSPNSLCNGSPTENWGYLNESDANYNAYVATLLAAKASVSTVTLYLIRVAAGATSYCHIGYISVQ